MFTQRKEIVLPPWQGHKRALEYAPDDPATPWRICGEGCSWYFADAEAALFWYFEEREGTQQ